MTQLVKDLTLGFTNATREGSAAATAIALVEKAAKGLAAGLVWAKGLWSVFTFGAEGAGMWVNEVYVQLRNLGLAMKNLSFSGVKDEWSFFQEQMTQRAQQFKNDFISAHNEMYRELQTIFATRDRNARFRAGGTGGGS